MNQVDSFVLAQVALSYIRNHGFNIEQTCDEARVQSCITEIGKTYLTPMLNPRANDFTEQNHFWMVLSKQGQPALIGGARLDDLGGEPVTQFWHRSMRRMYGDQSKTAAGQFSELCDKAITGRVAYFGDMFGSEAVRGQPSLLRSFLTIAHLSAQIKWSPDVIYAFMRGGDIDRGADRAYGFLNGIPNPQAWLLEAPYRDDAEWCVFNRKDEIEPAVRALVQRIS